MLTIVFGQILTDTPPFGFKVDDSQWKTYQNKRPGSGSNSRFSLGPKTAPFTSSEQPIDSERSTQQARSRDKSIATRDDNVKGTRRYILNNKE